MITIKKAVLNFPALFTLPTINGETQSKYSTKVILDPVEHKAVIAQLQAEIAALTKEKLKGVKIPSDKLCLRNGDDLMKPEYEGKMVLSASNKKRPVVIKGLSETVTEDDGLIYSGCICNVNVNLWAQDNKFGKRINAELLAVQWKAEGTPIAGNGITREAALQGFDDDEEDFG